MRTPSLESVKTYVQSEQGKKTPHSRDLRIASVAWYVLVGSYQVVVSHVMWAVKFARYDFSIALIILDLF